MNIRDVKYLLFSSDNSTLFYNNFNFWFLLKLYLSYYYGINIYLIFFGFSAWSFWEYAYHRFLMHGLKNTPYYQTLHGHHHLTPSKPAYIPVYQYLLICPSFFIVSYYVNPSYVFSYSVGHMYGLYCFEKIHTLMHNDAKNENIVTKYHNYHHKYGNIAYCFTSPAFDIFFNTFPNKHFSYNILALLPIPYFSFYGVIEKSK
uniref:Fatty acid hydroxylase domain-containing protein n=1 Tax=viral metagenome TaxID=1070528 RepID=A0A6C0JF54_9ZZZZ